MFSYSWAVFPQSFTRFCTGVVTIQASVSMFYYGKARCCPGCIRWRPGFCRRTKVMSRYFPVLKIIETGENHGDIRVIWDATGANRCSPRTNPSSRFIMVESPFLQKQPSFDPGTHDLRRVILVYHGRTAVVSRFVPVTHRFYPVFDSLPVRNNCIEHFYRTSSV